MNKLKIILLNICIFFLFVIFVLCLVGILSNLSSYTNEISTQKQNLQYYIDHPDIVGVSDGIIFTEYQINTLQESITKYSVYATLGFLSVFATAFIFVYCNPRLFRHSTWVNLSEEWAKNKQERAAARQAKADADKQKRIEELQKELDELHGSDKSNQLLFK